jgi:hypothetical protein
LAPFGRGFGSGGNVSFGQSGQLCLIADHQGGRVGIRQHLVPELVRQLRLLFVQRAHRGFVGVRQKRSGTHEIAVLAIADFELVDPVVAQLH